MSPMSSPSPGRAGVRPNVPLPGGTATAAAASAAAPRGHTPLGAPSGDEVVRLSGRAVLILILKEGLLSAAKLVLRGIWLLLEGGASVGATAYRERGRLLVPLQATSGMVAAAWKALMSSGPARAVAAVLASVICLRLQYVARRSGLTRGSRAHLHTNLSLLFGLIR